MRLALRNVLFTLSLPGAGAVYVPLLVLRPSATAAAADAYLARLLPAEITSDTLCFMQRKTLDDGSKPILPSERNLLEAMRSLEARGEKRVYGLQIGEELQRLGFEYRATGFSLMYRILDRLATFSPPLVKSELEDQTEAMTPNGKTRPRRRYYELTDEGRNNGARQLVPTTYGALARSARPKVQPDPQPAAG